MIDKRKQYNPGMSHLILGGLMLACICLVACSDDDDLPTQTQVIQASPTPPLPSIKPADVFKLKGEDGTYQCEVIIAGGSTAALAAALTSARENRVTCWLEPTDWPGGQLTAVGNSAVDFASYQIGTVDMETLVQHPQNQVREFAGWLQALKGNPGQCWVSKKCFPPQQLLKQQIFPTINQEIKRGFLYPFYNTVTKTVQTDKNQIVGLTAVQRSPKQGVGYERFFSQAIADWYSPEDSEYFSKKMHRFRGRSGHPPVVIDASELGDVLVLSGAPFLQGQEMKEGVPENETSICGQAFSFPLVMEYAKKPRPEITPAPLSPRSENFYSDRAWERRFSWGEIWSYRRILTPESINPKTQWPRLIQAHPGDLSLQNWNPGNDYPFGSLFKNIEQTRSERANWQGGLNLLQIEAAEKHALGWFQWLRSRAPEKLRPQIVLDRSVLGTPTGLARFPYIRDTRRSIGLEGFVMRLEAIKPQPQGQTGKVFGDRVGIGAYHVDIHPLKCRYSIKTLQSHAIAPYYLPYRALTNQRFGNLLVAGKTMAQSFLVNASTRIQDIEWRSGIAAGVSAAYLSQGHVDSAALLGQMKPLQQSIQKYAPIDWHWPPMPKPKVSPIPRQSAQPQAPTPAIKTADPKPIPQAE